MRSIKQKKQGEIVCGFINLEKLVGHGICGKSGRGRKMLLHFLHLIHPYISKTNNHSQIKLPHPAHAPYQLPCRQWP